MDSRGVPRTLGLDGFVEGVQSKREVAGSMEQKLRLQDQNQREPMEVAPLRAIGSLPNDGQDKRKAGHSKSFGI